jgi:hypothetical protein
VLGYGSCTLYDYVAIALLRSQIATAKDLSKIRTLPYAFTRNGIGMLSSVTDSPDPGVLFVGMMDAALEGKLSDCCDNDLNVTLDAYFMIFAGLHLSGTS